MKQLLFISIAAPPKTGPESLQSAKYLYHLSKRFNITLITKKNNDNWRKDDDSLVATLRNVSKVIEINIFYQRILNFFLRKIASWRLAMPDPDFVFPLYWRKVVKNIDAPDVIYSRSTPISSALLALNLKKKYKVPWIMHMSDPWVLSPHFGYDGHVRRFNEEKEFECLTHADKITFTSEETIELYREKYPEFVDKFALFPNVFDEREVEPNPFLFTEKMKILHSGNFYGEGREPTPILEALNMLKESNKQLYEKLDVTFAGRFNEDIQAKFNKYNLEVVNIIQEVSFTQSVSLQRGAHILILIDWNFRHGKSVFFLSKILGYMASQRPILAITQKGSTSDKFITRGYGNCFEHHEVERIAKFILDALEAFVKRDQSFFEVKEIDMDYSDRINGNKLADFIVNMIS